MLHQKYYQDYGLAISGLVMHHKVDPLEYNREVDDALPLDGLITPNPELRQLLEDMDKSKIKLWLFTNGHITHGQRVVGLLGIEDLFEGITFCDYRKMPFVCKPHREMFEKAEAEAGVTATENCYFVGGLVFLLSEKDSHSSLQMTRISIVDTLKPADGPLCIYWNRICRSLLKEQPSIRSET
ncbi:MAG: hypothetical protein LQ343_001195 [Gyalolechia ehrenbergii]|nr:MAG: hypothetical protein LQ343_001195 [Gyalolechia ehrenbergii]